MSEPTVYPYGLYHAVRFDTKNKVWIVRSVSVEKHNGYYDIMIKDINDKSYVVFKTYNKFASAVDKLEGLDTYMYSIKMSVSDMKDFIINYTKSRRDEMLKECNKMSEDIEIMEETR